MNTGDQKRDDRSAARLAKVDSRLRRLFKAVAEGPARFVITEGLRTKERQAELVAAGASRTMKSKHLIGHAVDVAIVVGKEIRWDWPLYVMFAQEVQAEADKLGIPIVWGGSWPTFKDGPHFELARP